MGYRERRLRADVEVWASTPGPLDAQRILPDGCLDLLLIDGRLLVAGPDRAARVHASSGPVFGVRLHAGHGPAALRIAADELTDRTVDLADLWGGRRTRSLAARVRTDPVRELGRWALDSQASPFGMQTVDLLRSGASVSVCAVRLGYSSRQLHRRCLAAFGYGPAHLARILRLQRALPLVDAGVPWSPVAARAGYFDQAHLARDVRALTGLTPSALRAERVRSVQDAA